MAHVFYLCNIPLDFVLVEFYVFLSYLVQYLVCTGIVLIQGGCSKNHVICDAEDPINVSKCALIPLFENFTGWHHTERQTVKTTMPQKRIKSALEDTLLIQLNLPERVIFLN